MKASNEDSVEVQRWLQVNRSQKQVRSGNVGKEGRYVVAMALTRIPYAQKQQSW